jgi:hypothetical protein
MSDQSHILHSELVRRTTWNVLSLSNFWRVGTMNSWPKKWPLSQRISYRHIILWALIPNTFLAIIQMAFLGMMGLLIIINFLRSLGSHLQFCTRVCIRHFHVSVSQRPVHVPVQDLQTLNCPDPYKLNSNFRCYTRCHKTFYDLHCAVRHAHALYNWLEYHIKTKQYVRCPKDMTRHTAVFSSVIKQN